MFETTIGPVKDAGSTVYLRPETAQGIFLDFKTTLQYARKKPPFGIAQVGKSFRNEITPGNFIFRTLEFEQMEMEFFVPPAEAEKWHEYWMEAADGVVRVARHRPRTRCGCARTAPTSCRTTRAATSDIEYLYPIGWSELEGIANRGDFDLTPARRVLGAEARVRQHGQRRALRAARDRAGRRAWAAPCSRSSATPTTRTTSAASSAPCCGSPRTWRRSRSAVLPLVNKDGQPEKARAIYEELRDADDRRVRHRRLDRQALPAPGRDRHAVRGDGRPPDDGGRHGHPARPRHARAGPRAGRRASGRDRAPAAAASAATRPSSDGRASAPASAAARLARSVQRPTVARRRRMARVRRRRREWPGSARQRAARRRSRWSTT